MIFAFLALVPQWLEYLHISADGWITPCLSLLKTTLHRSVEIGAVLSWLSCGLAIVFLFKLLIKALKHSSRAILYKSSNEMSIHDFQLEQVVTREDSVQKRNGPKGSATIQVKDGILTYKRQNTEGRCFVKLQTYKINNLSHPFIFNDAADGIKRYRITYRVKASVGVLKILMRFTNDNMGDPLWKAFATSSEYEIRSDKWQKMELVTPIEPSKKAVLRLFENQEADRVDAELQIKDILLEEFT